MRTISLFSGVGGLDDPDDPPILCCELKSECWPVLKRRFDDVEVWQDVRSLDPPEADVVSGGWPCQDISMNGKREGLDGERSGLFFELVRIARQSGAHSVVCENVPNLLKMDGGAQFERVLRELVDAGFEHVAWRILDARWFGLPQERARVFFVASRHADVAEALHRPLEFHHDAVCEPQADSFYWTTGYATYRWGYTPTITAGSSVGIPSPPAVRYGDRVRKLTASECLRLQGFDPTDFRGVARKEMFQMAGNAVAGPVGQFVAKSVGGGDFGESTKIRIAADGIVDAGILHGTERWAVDHANQTIPAATNLHEFVDTDSRSRLSPKASRGFLRRLSRTGSVCPDETVSILERYAGASIERIALEDDGNEDFVRVREASIFDSLG